MARARAQYLAPARGGLVGRAAGGLVRAGGWWRRWLLCCVPGQESRQGGRVPAAGVDQGGGVVCCAMDQAGGRRDPVQSVQQISNQRGVIRCGRWCPMCCGSGRASGVYQEKKEAGRARRVWRCPACFAVCCCDLLPWPRSTERRRGYCFTVFPGGTLRRAGGVRFSTLPGSALCVGLELSEL